MGAVIGVSRRLPKNIPAETDYLAETEKRRRGSRSRDARGDQLAVTSRRMEATKVQAASTMVQRQSV